MSITSPIHAFEMAIDAAGMEPYLRASANDLHGDSGMDVYVSRVFPMKDDNLCVHYVMEHGESGGAREKSLLGACLSLDGAIPERYQNRGNVVVTAPEIGLAIPVFPFDPSLPQLEQWEEPQFAWPRLREWLGWSGQEPSQMSRIVQSYRLERRCVLRYDVIGVDGEALRCYLKLARPGKLRRAARSFEELRRRGFEETGPHAVPGFLHTEGEGVAFMNEVSGTSLHDAIGSADLPGAFESAARLLRKLHGSRPVDRSGVLTPTAEVEKLRSWERIVTRIYPDMTAEFHSRLEGIAGARPGVVSRPVPVHSDFHDKQVIHSNEQTSLIDCDGVMNGDPRLDYGNLIAHMELRRMQHPEHAESIGEAVSAFRRTYPLEDGVEWWAAGTFLRLAAIYSLRPRWRHLTERLLALADVDAARAVMA